MTTFNTTDLTAAIMGDEAIETPAARKASTRTLRKFLRDDTSGVDSVGKGGRYSIDLNKTQIKAMTKRFLAWQAKQDEEKAARRAALESVKVAKVTETIATEDDAPETDTEDDTDEALEGPSDEEIAEMLTDEDEV